MEQKGIQLTGDNNIIAYVITVLTLLEKVKKLDAKELDVFKNLLKDADFFGSTTDKVASSLPFTQWSADKDLEEYFGLLQSTK